MNNQKEKLPVHVTKQNSKFSLKQKIAAFFVSGAVLASVVGLCNTLTVSSLPNPQYNPSQDLIDRVYRVTRSRKFCNEQGYGSIEFEQHVGNIMHSFQVHTYRGILNLTIHKYDTKQGREITPYIHIFDRGADGLGNGDDSNYLIHEYMRVAGQEESKFASFEDMSYGEKCIAQVTYANALRNIDVFLDEMQGAQIIESKLGDRKERSSKTKLYVSGRNLKLSEVIKQ